MSFLLSYLLGISISYKMLDLKYLTIATQEKIKHGLHREFIKISCECYKKKEKLSDNLKTVKSHY